jgi:hypothetical protein
MQPSQGTLYSSATVSSPTVSVATKAQSDAEECAWLNTATADCGAMKKCAGDTKPEQHRHCSRLDAKRKAATAVEEQV